MKNEYGVDLTMGEAMEALVSVWDEGFWKAAEPVREWTPGSDDDENTFGEFKEEAK